MKQKFLKGMGVILTCGSLIVSISSSAWAKVPQAAWEYADDTEKGRIIYDFEEVVLKLPKDWEGKYEIEEQGDSAAFYHKASKEAGEKDGEESCGYIFSLNWSDNYDFAKNLPNYYLVGSGKDKVYYITVPGDLHGYHKNEELLNEWKKMSDDVTEICKSAVSEYPGAPMYTTSDVNFRDGQTTNSKVLDVIPSDSEVWVTGNLDMDWTYVAYDEKKGYVKSDYLEFPSVIDQAGEEKSDTGDETNSNTGTDKGTSSGSGNNSEIPPQGAFQMVLYNIYTDEDVIVKRGDDGNWYDDDGVSYGDAEALMDEGSMIINENGDTFYWQILEKTPSGAIRQGAFQAMLYRSNGEGVLVKYRDGGWYDENDVLYGNVDDAMDTGEQIVNENGEVFYLTLPE